MEYINIDNWLLEKYTHPYPHITIDNFLKPSVYKLVEKSFPPDEVFFSNDQSFSGNSPRGIDNNKIISKKIQSTAEYSPSKIWDDLFVFFTSEQFFYWICEKYETDIRGHFPMLYEDLKDGNITLATARNLVDTESYDILLDFAYVINSPVTVKSESRGPHLDNPRVLFNGLCYLRDDSDPSSGGGHVVYSCIDKIIIKPKGRSVNKKQLETAKEIRYGTNNFISFLNTPKAVHGVGVREITTFPRRSFQFNAVLSDRYFEKVKKQAHTDVVKAKSCGFIGRLREYWVYR